MNSKAAKLLVVESDDALRKQIVAVLSDAGYEVSADYREGMKAVLAFDPDAVVLGPTHLSLIAVTFFPKSRVPSILTTYAL
jgi:DNA-binding NtrC family response regulator